MGFSWGTAVGWAGCTSIEHLAVAPGSGWFCFAVAAEGEPGDSRCAREKVDCEQTRRKANERARAAGAAAKLGECRAAKSATCVTYEAARRPRAGGSNPGWSPRFQCTAAPAACEALRDGLASRPDVRKLSGCDPTE